MQIHLSQVDLPPQDSPQKRTLPAGAEEMSLKRVCRIELEDIKREYLHSFLTQTRGNISRAADQADITRRTLYNKL